MSTVSVDKNYYPGTEDGICDYYCAEFCREVESTQGDRQKNLEVAC
jgi:hypothetical protein